MQHAHLLLSPLDYLAREIQEHGRHEYVNGHVYALSGTSTRHGRLVTNLVRHTSSAAVGRSSCAVFSQCVKVHVAARNSFYYPDVVATCEPGTTDEYIICEPCFVVEVLSPSTASIDRREKRLAYATLDSLQEYVLVYQDCMRADVYRRTADSWNLAILREPQQVVYLTCLACSLTLQQIYEGVNLPLGVSEEVEEGWTYA